MGCNDAELIERWRRGDPTAFEALVRRWQQPMARFLFRLVGRAGPIPDLCQEVFLRAYRAGPRYRETGAFSAWLYRIALNAVRDAARRGRRAPQPLDGPNVVDGAAPADAACASRETARLVAEAVAGLPEPLRLVLVLHHYERLNFAEIGRLTGTPASTLKSRFAAALQHLRRRLQELGLGPEEIAP
jgi:RNA polymerase sigma-70 factor (ECF subfamily)